MQAWIHPHQLAYNVLYLHVQQSIHRIWLCIWDICFLSRLQPFSWFGLKCRNFKLHTMFDVLHIQGTTFDKKSGTEILRLHHIISLNCSKYTNWVHFFIANLPISLPGFLLVFSGLFQTFSKITDSAATAIPNAKTMKAVKMLSKEIALKAPSSHTVSEYLEKGK